jgi:type IV pilus assembly protein PilW
MKFRFSRRLNMLKRPQSGLSLVELMVAMVIALLIAAAIGGLYIGTKETNRLQDGANYARESGIAISEQIAREIRKAGHYGCFQWKEGATPPLLTRAVLPTVGGGSGYYPITTADPPTNSIPKIGPQYDVFGGPASVANIGLPTATGLVPVVGSDFIEITYGQPVAFLNEDMTDSISKLKLAKEIFVKDGQPFLLANCGEMTLLRVDDGGVTGGNFDELSHDPALGNNVAVSSSELGVFKRGAQLMSLAKSTFFLATNTADGITSLYQWDSGNRVAASALGSAPFATNVVNMKALYGVDNAGAILWLDGPTVTANAQWAQVQAVQINYVVASAEPSFDTSPKELVWNTAQRRFVTGVNPAPGSKPQQSYSFVASIRGKVQYR